MRRDWECVRVRWCFHTNGADKCFYFHFYCRVLSPRRGGWLNFFVHRQRKAQVLGAGLSRFLTKRASAAFKHRVQLLQAKTDRDLMFNVGASAARVRAGERSASISRQSLVWCFPHHFTGSSSVVSLNDMQRRKGVGDTPAECLTQSASVQTNLHTKWPT